LINKILSTGSSQSYFIGVDTVEVTVSNLQASTTYYTYCYVQTIYYKGISLTQILKTYQEVTTLCCKEIKFTNAPLTIYGDTSKYNSGTDPKQYIYSFTLSSPPSSSSLSIVPSLYNTDGQLLNDSHVLFRPPSFAFESNSIVLSRKFIIQEIHGNNKLNGKHMLSLSETNSESSEYRFPKLLMINILSSDMELPPPKITNATFSNSGSALLILFDSPTNFGRITSVYWKCSSLFQFYNDVNSNCTWISSSLVQANLGPYDKSVKFISPNDKIVLLSRKLHNLQENQTVIIRSPDKPVIPNVVLSVIRTISYCSDVTIDATFSSGDGSRDWISIIWNITSIYDNTGTGKILQYLNQNGLTTLTPITIPSHLFQWTTYIVSLTLTNYLLQSRSQTAVFTIVGNSNIPQIRFKQASQFSILNSNKLTIQAVISRPYCADKFQMSYNWTIQNSMNEYIKFLSLQPKDVTSIYLAPYALNGGDKYRVTAEVTALPTENNPIETTVSSSVVVTVKKGPLVAVISQGSIFVVPFKSNFPLDASSTIDTSKRKVNNINNLQFKWSCIIISPASYGIPCNIQQDSTSLISYKYIIDGTMLTTEVLYEVTVLVSSTDGRNSEASIIISSNGELSSAYVQASSGLSTTSVVDTDARVTIKGVIKHLQGNTENNYTALWISYKNGEEYTVSSLTPLSTFVSFQPIRNNYREIVTADTFNFPLVIPQKTLPPGATITFRLEINEMGSKFSSYSETKVIVNQPPDAGSLRVDPFNGYSFSTIFMISMSQYSSEASNYPLSYSFSFQLSPTSNILGLQLQCGSNSVRTILPAGYDFMNFLVDIIGVVYDSLGSSTTDIRNVSVLELENVEYYSYLTGSLSDSFDVANDIKVSNVVASTISKVNCSSVNKEFCNLRNRLPCQNTPQQCSSCKNGYIGIVGDSNIRCISVNSSVVFGRVGDTCQSNSDCLFNNCNGGTCMDISKQCPSSISNHECSGHGNCIYTDSSNSIVSSCTQSDVTCMAACQCMRNYGDVDCSLDPFALNQADLTIRKMCQTFNHYIETGSLDLLPSVIDGAVNSADVIYSPTKVTTESEATCKN
jgi:hypothetical protein